jgi:hypothetical protein
MKTIYIILLTILISCSSCKELDICKDESLTLKKVEFTGVQLRTDGFYYGSPTTDYQGVISYELFIFYKNGVLMLPGNQELKKMEEYIITIANSNQENTKFVWGVFNIEDKIIKLEHWAAAQCGYPTILRTGEILNDTTFVLKRMEIRDRKGVRETDINEEFHFKQFDTKPDSTNNFIK